MQVFMAIQELGLNNNLFHVNQSNEPNHIVKWYGDDPQPTQQELEAAWESFLEKNPDYGKEPI